MSASNPERFDDPLSRPSVSIEELIQAKNVRPIDSLDDLTADTFASDEELDEFLAFTAAARHADLA